MLRVEVGSMKAAGHLGYLHGSTVALDVLILRAAILEMPLSETQIEETKKGESAAFPVKAKDLPDLSGKDLGARLKVLEARWIASEFTLSKSDLLK